MVERNLLKVLQDTAHCPSLCIGKYKKSDCLKSSIFFNSESMCSYFLMNLKKELSYHHEFATDYLLGLVKTQILQ